MNDNTQDENKLIAQRREKLQSRREQGVAFPNDFRREDLAEDLTRELGDKSKEELKELDRQAKVAGASWPSGGLSWSFRT